MDRSAATGGNIDWRTHRELRRRALRWGCAAGTALVAVYVAVLALSNSLEHAVDEFVQLRFWMTSLITGFALQVGLFAYARGASRGAAHAQGVVASGGAGTISMIACCAHHLTDVLPLIGLAGVALFLGSYQTLFLLLGVLSNAVGVVYVLGVLRRHRLFPARRSVLSLLAGWPADRALVPVAAGAVAVFVTAVIVAFT